MLATYQSEDAVGGQHGERSDRSERQAVQQVQGKAVIMDLRKANLLTTDGRGAPYCAFIGEEWQRDVSTVDLTLRCFRRDPKTKQAADWTVTVRREGGLSHLGASYWPVSALP